MAALIRKRYEVLEVLGRGGQGAVLKARDRQHDRIVAMKVRSVDSEDDRRAVLVEAGVLLDLRPHRGLPVMREDFFEAGRYFIVMDWIEGRSLTQVIAEEGQPGIAPFSRVQRYLEQVAAALDHLHRQDPPVVHKDVKPANLVLTPEDEVTLVDFGLAHVAGEHVGSLGTLHYYAPELAAGSPATPASDVYSFSATAFTLLTGKEPRGGRPPWSGLAEDQIGPVERALRRGLAIDPTSRPVSAGELMGTLRTDLEGILATEPAPIVSRVVPNNLPSRRVSFVGREAELEAVRGHVLSTRLVTITGVAGTGKTSLALQAATQLLGRFPEGVHLVELSAVSDAALVAEEIASVVKAPPAHGAGGMRSTADQLVAHLRYQRQLLVLDNCEHVVTPTAQIVARLLEECPDVSILATSREALGVGGEQTLPLPPLEVPARSVSSSAAEVLRFESARLLTDRARAIDPDFSITDTNAGAVAEVCRRFDGLPLAIELAAPRVVALSPENVVEHLDDQVRLLTGGRRTAVERHQTLRTAIDWSYELLSGGAKRLLPRLSVFRGGWTLEAAESVASDDEHAGFTVVDALHELVDKSIVVVNRGEAATRYRMVEPMRQYALEKLAATGHAAETRDRHAAWVTELLGAPSLEAYVERQSNPETMLAALSEHENAIEAMHWLLERGDGDAMARICLGTLSGFFSTGRYGEGLQLVDAALACEGVHDWARYLILTLSAYFPLLMGDLQAATTRVEQSISAGEASPEVTSLRFTTLARATICWWGLGDLGRMRGELEAARDEAGAAGDQWSNLWGTCLIGCATTWGGDHERGLALLEQAYEPVKDLPVAWVPYMPPWIAFTKALARHDDAVTAAEYAVEVAANDPAALVTALMARAAAGPAEDARVAYVEAAHVTRRYGLGPRAVLVAALYDARYHDDAATASVVLGALSTQVDDLTALVFAEDLRGWARERLGGDAFHERFAVGRHRPDVIDAFCDTE